MSPGVQDTCISSLKSKFSSSFHGYLKVGNWTEESSNHESFQKFLEEDKKFRRSALINRGYGLRQLVIDWVVNSVCEDSELQIVNLGCGLDPLYFRFKSRLKVRYFLEVDFPDVIEKKISKIIHSELIDGAKVGELGLITEKYGCVGADLTASHEMIDIIELALPGFCRAAPTIFISECVLSYLHAEKADDLISRITGRFEKPVYFLLYEQITPVMDWFSRTMLGHFRKIKSPLFSVEQKYRTLEDHGKRFQTMGCYRTQGISMHDLYFHFDKEFDLVSKWARIEPFDEREEWDIKMQHYMLFIATNSSIECSVPGLERCMNLLKEANTNNLSNIPFLPIRGDDNYGSDTFFGYKRWGHSSVVIGNDMAIVFGGNGVAFDSVDGSGVTGRHDDALLLEFSTSSTIKVENSLQSGFTGDNAPIPRVHHQMAQYMENGNMEFMLFGGRDSPSNALGDTWLGKIVIHPGGLSSQRRAELSWRRIDSEQRPSARYRHAMTCVEHNSQSFIIVSGGLDSSGRVLDDIWVFSNSKWQSIDVKCGTQGWIQDGILKRHSHTIHYFNGKILLLGGRHDDKNTHVPFLVVISLPDQTNNGPWEILDCTDIEKTSWIRYGHMAHYLQDGQTLLILGGCTRLVSKIGSYSSRALLLSFGKNGNLVRVIDASNTIPENVDFSLIKSSSLYHAPTDVLWIFGGGFTCFSMGSHFDQGFARIAGLKSRLACGYTEISHGPKSFDHIPIIMYDKSSSYEEYLYNEPFVLRNVNFGPLMNEWTWQDLRDSCDHDMKISVHFSRVPELSFHQRNFEYRTISWREFIEMLFTKTQQNDDAGYYYMRAVDGRHNVTDLEKNFPRISAAFCFPDNIIPDIKKKAFSSVLRISSPFVQLWTHYDVMDNVLCQIWGSKRVILWPPKDLKHLSIKGSSTTSSLHPISDKDFPKTHPVICDMRPGDVLYIPPCWFHHVTAGSEPSLAINTFWKEESEHLYDIKDLFGNRDLIPFSKAMDKLAAVIKEMKKDLPERYSGFYLDKLQLFIDEFKNKS